MIWHFLLPFCKSPQKRMLQSGGNALFCSFVRQSQVTMRRRSWSLATMETQLEMLGILYSVALRAENATNGVRSVIEFFKTFQRALQEISKPEPISECIRRIGGWCWDLSLKKQLEQTIHLQAWIWHLLVWLQCLVSNGMGYHGGPRGQEIWWCLRCHRVQSQSLVMVIEGDNYVDVYHNSSLGFVRTFFLKKVPKVMPKQQFKIWKGGSWRAKDQCGHLLQSFQRSKFAQLQSLAGFGARNGTWNEKCVW